VQVAQPGRRLLLKNPANSARVAALRERFPGAKFIHIHRHPEEVYASTLLLHRKAQEAWGLQDGDPTRLRETVLANYADLMAACFAQTCGMPASDLIEVRMSYLERNPLPTLQAIYKQLDLPGFATAANRFTSYLDRCGIFPKNRLSLSADERNAIRRSLAHVFERWGYQ